MELAPGDTSAAGREHSAGAGTGTSCSRLVPGGVSGDV